MARQYWVGDFHVDLSRNQISRINIADDGQSQTLPPKALQVLTLLAANQGKVVTYDEIFEVVWPDTIVTHNTLQRAIAQLRKALGESSKSQDIIETHSKQGYSLECDVKWLVDAEPEDAVKTAIPGSEIQTSETPTSKTDAETPNDDQRNKKLFATAVIVVALMLFSHWLLSPQFESQAPDSETVTEHQSVPLKIKEMRYITATDHKEFDANYALDGKYITFHRYPEKLCHNTIWAKNAETLEEFKLTKELATYRHHSLSPNGKNLVFIKQEDCEKPVTQVQCYRLMSIDFEAALSQPQSARELLECENAMIFKPVWIDDENIVMMQRDDQQWRLVRYSVTNEEVSNFYQIENGSVMNLAWSGALNLMAVTSTQSDPMTGEVVQHIDMLQPNGTLLSSYPIQLPDSVKKHFWVYADFVPDRDKLGFMEDGKLFYLSYKGEVQETAVQIDTNSDRPIFHPDGKRLLTVNGIYDSDLAQLNLSATLAESDHVEESKYQILERSIYHEDIAKFHPTRDSIAYVSARTGSEQVWLYKNGKSLMLSALPGKPYIGDLHWDYEGKNLLVLANDELYGISALPGELKSQQSTAMEFPYPINDLFHWDSDNNIIYANIVINGEAKFVTIDLASMGYQLINSKTVRWASKTREGDLYFMDRLERFWRAGSLENTLLEHLTGQLGFKRRFVLDDDFMYGVNKNFRLWSYDLTTLEFNYLADLNEDVDYLTDVKENQLLLTLIIAAKKEVVEVIIE